MIHCKVVCAYLYLISRYGYPPPAEDTTAHLRELKAMGFESVELEGIREPHLTRVHAIRDEVAKTVRELELTVPYFCVVLPGLGSSEASERQRNLALFAKGCEVAATLGARGVLDNAPLPPYRFPGDIPVVRHYDEDVLGQASWPADLDWGTYWQALVGTYREACDIAAARGLTYQMHPAVGCLASNTDAFLHFFDAVKRDNLRFTFDTANQFLMKEPLPLSLIRLRGLVDYIHVSDNTGREPGHLAMGDGAIHWEGFFEALDRIGFDGHLGIDIGGDESAVSDLAGAYGAAARLLSGHVR